MKAKYTVEYKLGGLVAHKAEFEAINAKEAHDTFASHIAALGLTATVIDIHMQHNFLNETKELSRDVAQTLERIQREFDAMYNAQTFVDEHQYKALAAWYDMHLEGFTVMP